MAIINVMAPQGRKFPLEHNVKNYITTEPVGVESSAYYRHALLDGDLVLANAPANVSTAAVDAAAEAVAELAPPAEQKKKTKGETNV